MHKCAEKCILEDVLSRCIHNLGSIWELHCFITIYVQGDRVKVRFWVDCRVAVPSVAILGTYLEHVAYRRVVTNLLHEDLASILQTCLVSLSKDRIEGLVKHMSRVNKTQRLSHHKFHSFDWVRTQSRSIQVYR